MLQANDSRRRPPDATLTHAIAAGRELHSQCCADHGRRLLLLEGDPDWTFQAAHGIADALHQNGEPIQACWIGRGPPGKTRPVSQARALLGGEQDLVIVDGFSGLDPDALAAAAGALRGGGLLLLLAPPLSEWPQWLDPRAERIATHPYRAADVGRRFLARAASLLAASPAVIRLDPNQHQNHAPEPAHHHEHGIRAIAPTASGPLDGAALTTDQARIVAAILRLAETAAPAPLVVTAERGRGKSTALGQAAARLIATHSGSLLVSAPRYQSARLLLEHARLSLGDLVKGRRDPHSNPRFYPPDQLARDRPSADLLLIDEAAGIPAPLLQQICGDYPRLVLCTTTQGYEGTGRGFTLKFFDWLDQARPGWQQLTLEEPIRWSAADPLDGLINRLLMLDVAAPTDQDIAASADQPLHAVEYDRDQLSADQDQLSAVFGLLMSAHYQTRPSDLRQFLDGPNLRIHAIKRGPMVVATALVAEEGGFATHLTQAIFTGQRRPRGHLLPQTLAAHAGLEQAPRLKMTRIVRIAVHPALRRQGLARQLLDVIGEQAKQAGQDALGASFGLKAELLELWCACGFEAVHLGSSRNAASGARGAVVLRALSPAGQALIAQARERFPARLLTLLPGRLADLEPADVLTLLRAAGSKPREPNPQPRLALDIESELSGFAHGHRGLEAALPVLMLLAPEPLIDAWTGHHVADRDAQAFVAVILQQHRPEAVSRRLGYSGRAALIRALRQTAATLLRSLTADDPTRSHSARHGESNSPDDHSPGRPPA